MIEHSLSDFREDRIAEKLWDAYVSIDYGRAVPEKGYKGFKTFIEDVTKADSVEGTAKSVTTLCFEDEGKYTWFLLKWS